MPQFREDSIKDKHEPAIGASRQIVDTLPLFVRAAHAASQPSATQRDKAALHDAHKVYLGLAVYS